MYDEDKTTESDEKCDHCERWAHCTTNKKNEQFCFERKQKRKSKPKPGEESE